METGIQPTECPRPADDDPAGCSRGTPSSPTVPGTEAPWASGHRPKRPALEYFGGKFALANWIMSFFPRHICYVEPFGGGGSVLLCKPRSKYEVYNDLDGDVVNFFRVLRERPDELIRKIALTPWSRAEHGLTYRKTRDPIERARRLYVRSWQGHGSKLGQWRTGWKYFRFYDGRGGCSNLSTWRNIGHLSVVADRLLYVQIECAPALRVMERFDGESTLFYLDPPYHPDTRSRRWRNRAYAHDMTEKDHLRLLDSIQQLKGMIVLSGYESGLYTETLKDWRITRSTTRSWNNRGGRTQECVWLNPALVAHYPNMTLFAEERPDAMMQGEIG